VQLRVILAQQSAVSGRRRTGGRGPASWRVWKLAEPFFVLDTPMLSDEWLGAVVHRNPHAPIDDC
jgi:hypothetical protein